MVDSDDTFNAPLIERDVLLSGNRHKVVRCEGLGVDLGQELPFVPAIIMLRCGQTERFKRLGPAEQLVAQRPREKPRQHGVVRLPDQYELIALLLNDHGAALFRSGASQWRLLGRGAGFRPRGWPNATLNYNLLCSRGRGTIQC